MNLEKIKKIQIFYRKRFISTRVQVVCKIFDNIDSEDVFMNRFMVVPKIKIVIYNIIKSCLFFMKQFSDFDEYNMKLIVHNFMYCLLLHKFPEENLFGSVGVEMFYIVNALFNSFLDLYTISNVNEVFPLTVTNTGSITIDPVDQYRHRVVGLGTISGANLRISSMVNCRIYRDVSDVNDTLNADMGLMEIDFHYQMCGNGSTDMFIK